MLAFTADYLDGEIRVDATRSPRRAGSARRRMAGTGPAHLGLERAGRRASAAGTVAGTAQAAGPLIAAGSGLEVPPSAHRDRRSPVLRSCIARCSRSNQNGAPNSVVAAQIQPATCRANSRRAPAGSLTSRSAAPTAWRSAFVDRRPGAARDVGGQRRMLPQGVEQVDAVDVEQDRQQQRQQNEISIWRRCTSPTGAPSRCRTSRPAPPGRLAGRRRRAGTALAGAPQLRIGHGLDVGPEPGEVAWHAG